MRKPSFPPLFEGKDAQGGDPFRLACAAAEAGCDSGLVIYDIGTDLMRAAIVFAPDVSLQEAAVMLPLCGVGFQNALGAIGPPELPVQLGWDGPIFVNGGRCGRLSMAAADETPEEPDWLVIGLTVTLWPPREDTGLTPDETALYAEGCAEVEPLALLEAWVRHTLAGINQWIDSGTAPLHREWSGLALGLEGEITAGGKKGTYKGLDENLGLLLKTGGKTVLVPLTAHLTRPI